MEEAIAAVATGAARAAIGAIRLSGAGCVEALEAVFSAGKTPLTARPERTLALGVVRDRTGAVIDHALATYSRAPHSYTGEDTAELHCHGAPTVLRMALEALFAQGVRMARPGEFTRRAFLNGKLDLLEAEGVMDLIDARSPAAVRQAAGQLGGALSGRIEDIYSGLIDLLAHFHATVDYPDEDLESFDPDVVRKRLAQAAGELDALIATYDRGAAVAQGVPCAIVGKPNVGKSSLLNALLGYDRAIVTDVPGTTRDTVEELCEVGDVPLRLTDTAGLRETNDTVERLGTERSRAALSNCRLALVVLDGSAPLTGEDRETLELAKAAPAALCLINKSDLPAVWAEDGLPFPALRVSARTGAGLEGLAAAVAGLFPPGAEGEALLTNARQLSAATEAREALSRAAKGLEEGLPVDLPLLDVEAAVEALGGLTGRRMIADVVDRVFSRFCVGK